jgi:hypothetical protein
MVEPNERLTHKDSFRYFDGMFFFQLRIPFFSSYSKHYVQKVKTINSATVSTFMLLNKRAIKFPWDVVGLMDTHTTTIFAQLFSNWTHWFIILLFYKSTNNIITFAIKQSLLW